MKLKRATVVLEEEEIDLRTLRFKHWPQEAQRAAMEVLRSKARVENPGGGFVPKG